jgi:hypothetical protein
MRTYCIEVVGVIKPRRPNYLTTQREEFLVPANQIEFYQLHTWPGTIVVHTDRPVRETIPAIVAAVHGVAPLLPEGNDVFRRSRQYLWDTALHSWGQSVTHVLGIPCYLCLRKDNSQPRLFRMGSCLRRPRQTRWDHDSEDANLGVPRICDRGRGDRSPKDSCASLCNFFGNTAA